MTWFRSSFEWAGDLYVRLFADWLHVDFLIRTAILLLMLWLIIYVASLIFKYILGPILVLLYVNVIKRAWNFLVIETLHEWIYINYYSKGDTRFRDLYMRLCDRVKHNRAMLDSTGYRAILKNGRVRRLGNGMMIAAAVIATLWVGAFGLNQEYARPAWVGVTTPEPTGESDDGYPGDADAYTHEDDAYNDEQDGTGQTEDGRDTTDIYPPGMVVPGRLPAEGQVIFSLTEDAALAGARLRDGPGIDSTVIEMLFGYDLLVYLGQYIEDSDVRALYWLRVRTPSGTEGYIASQLLYLQM